VLKKVLFSFKAKANVREKWQGNNKVVRNAKENEYYGCEESSDRSKDRMIETGKWHLVQDWHYTVSKV
jgi:hypothetical protein